MTTRTGGCANSRVVSEVKAPKREPINHPVSQGAVSRLGTLVGEGTPYKSLYSSTKASTPFGATDNTLAGPGANRTVMRAGSQAHHGPAQPMKPGRSLFK